MPTRFAAINRLSLKKRLLIASSLWLTAMILAAGVGIPKLVHDYLVSDAKNQLKLAMDEITAHVEADVSDKLSLPYRLSDPRFSQPYSGLYWVIASEDQSLRSRSLWDKNIKILSLPIRTKLLGAKGEKLIYITQTIYLPGVSSPVNILVGVDEAPLMATLNHLTRQLWFILGLLFAGILLLIGTQIGWSLRPLGKMQRELAALRAGKQNQLAEEYPNEVYPLVYDLNALLFHYQELLERARNHGGNLSHALKTPLSVLKNEIAALPQTEQQKLLPAIEQIQNHIDYHLGRARIAGAANILSVKSNPSERIDAISMAFDKVYASREIILINEIDSDIDVAVDSTDLDEMLGNLLENGYKWASSTIRVHSKLISNQLIEIYVEDDGPGIPEENHQHAIRRGVRLDETTPGTGLGLNIVSEMAHSYRGKLLLGKSTMGGLKVTLSVKVAAT
ncbi:ATP-binding protein [Vibrio sp. ZSDE26]|uniref:histidine kinase n=1 Tax=Vibrio amylolyticus TaxID=2847292 RepID=A0A9X1XUG9_9VIBR|nr:ATP-binding protein [Vibrio amylolyticus]MCK6265824.1 ATP-binding protein [Vibrio amylolyticus]